MTLAVNPWNEVYKITTSKAKNRSTNETPQKPDGSNPENMEETLELIFDLMIREDHPKKIQNTIRQSESRQRDR